MKRLFFTLLAFTMILACSTNETTELPIEQTVELNEEVLQTAKVEFMYNRQVAGIDYDKYIIDKITVQDLENAKTEFNGCVGRYGGVGVDVSETDTGWQVTYIFADQTVTYDISFWTALVECAHATANRMSFDGCASDTYRIFYSNDLGSWVMYSFVTGQSATLSEEQAKNICRDNSDPNGVRTTPNNIQEICHGDDWRVILYTFDDGSTQFYIHESGAWQVTTAVGAMDRCGEARD